MPQATTNKSQFSLWDPVCDVSSNLKLPRFWPSGVGARVFIPHTAINPQSQLGIGRCGRLSTIPGCCAFSRLYMRHLPLDLVVLVILNVPRYSFAWMSSSRVPLDDTFQLKCRDVQWYRCMFIIPSSASMRLMDYTPVLIWLCRAVVCLQVPPLRYFLSIAT